VYALLADAVLLLHAAFVGFIVLTVPCIYIGALLGWRWIRLKWLRVAHLVGICIVAAQAWAGVICPLTDLEIWLRRHANLEVYSDSFIEHWLQRILYWDFPAWVFIVAYSLFALLVVGTWFFVPPDKRAPRG
jgi:hypothetical protein